MASEPVDIGVVGGRAVAAMRLCDGLRGAVSRAAERAIDRQPVALRASALADVLALTSALCGTIEAMVGAMNAQAHEEAARAMEPARV